VSKCLTIGKNIHLPYFVLYLHLYISCGQFCFLTIHDYGVCEIMVIGGKILHCLLLREDTGVTFVSFNQFFLHV